MSKSGPGVPSAKGTDPKIEIEKPTWFSRQGVLWHFGRFRGDAPKRPPYNQVLVGREKERSSLIRQLLNLPKRSAFLVTGSRGSGKTRFVDHCLNAYEENLLARYMRTDAGRTFYWDRVMLLVLLILAAVSVSLFREIALLIFRFDNLLYIFLSVPLLVLAIVPLIYAEKISRLVFSSSGNASAGNPPIKIISYLATYVLLLIAVYIKPVAISILILVSLFFVYIWKNLFIRNSWKIIGVGVVNLLFLLIFVKIFIKIINYSSCIPSVSLFCIYFMLIVLIISACLVFGLYRYDVNKDESGKINKYAHYKFYFYYFPFLFFSCLVVFENVNWLRYIYFMLSVMFLTLTVATTNNNDENSLINVYDKAKLKIILVLKMFFFVSLTANVLKQPFFNIIKNNRYMIREEEWWFFGVSDVNFPAQFFSISVLLLMFLILEYNYIILPQGYRLFLKSTNPLWRMKREVGKEGGKGKSGPNDFFENQQHYMKYTFFWQIFNTWLPLITIRINLGFDTLDYRRVVEAMLLGLKKSFHRQFLSYSSLFANLQRVALFLLFCLLASVAGSVWFGNPTLEIIRRYETNQVSLIKYQDVSIPEVGTANGWIDNLHEFLQKFLYWEIVIDSSCSDDARDFPILKQLFGDMVYFSEININKVFPVRHDMKMAHNHIIISIYFYHIMLVIMMYLIYFSIRKRSVLFPYSRVYRDIGVMLSKFTSKTSGSTQESMPFKLPGFGNNFTKSAAWESDLLDPRTLELELISLLHRAQHPGIPLLQGPDHRMTLPQSEITFIFDELDKLGVRAFGVDEKEDLTPEHLILEKRRNIAIQSLLANMKNLLSSGSARYIFIGGRDIHDEWVADRAQRVPFLTNIFDAEFYLPSLLTDHPPHQSERMDWTARIREYLRIQFKTGKALLEDMHMVRFNSLIEHSAVNKFENAYNDYNLYNYRFEKRPDQKKDNMYLKLFQTNQLTFKYPWENISNEFQMDFFNDFLNFLTFRSYGNPKLLNSVLNSFIVNLEIVNFNNIYMNQNEFKTSEFLRFNLKDLFRIQMLSSIYRNIERKFNRKLIFGDDKPVITLFYIVNFLLKFHRRGFSWTSIEHVDELVHVHKSIETRSLIKEVIADWSDRYLDRIRNGIFDFRFSHDVSAELRLLSKFHLDELAAVNFTLDESRHLKALYRQLIKEEAGRPNFEYFAVLGELHEYDGDYLYARNYFQKALKQLDDTFLDNPLLRKLVLQVDSVGGNYFEQESKPTGNEPQETGDEPQEPESESPKAIPEKGKALVEFLNRVLTAPEMFQSSMDWAVNRLRFLIRIAMTYELASHFENARVGYRSAALFGRALYHAWLENKEQLEIQNLDMAKTLNIIFLPKFAEAWAMEKSPTTLDAGVGMLEQFLRSLKKDFLGFVKGVTEKPIGASGNKNAIHTHINFYVILAELLHKLGDLYFTKGKNLVSPEHFDPLTTTPNTHGFLSAASEKYLSGMAFLLVYFNLRVNESGWKYRLTWAGVKRDTRPTFVNENLPDYFVRVLLGIVRDLSFTMMAKTSVHGLTVNAPPDKARTFAIQFSGGGYQKEAVLNLLKPIFVDLAKFLSEKKLNFENPTEFMARKRYPTFKNLVNHEALSQRDSLMMSLALQLIASRELYKGGYPGKAIRSFLQTAETIQHYLEWILLYKIFEKSFPEIINLGSGGSASGGSDQPSSVPDKTLDNFSKELFAIGLFCLDEAEAIATSSTSSVRNVQRSHISHGLNSLIKLYRSIDIPLGEDREVDCFWEKNLSQIKADCIEKLYPFGFRLRGMKTLSDHLVLQRLLLENSYSPGNQADIRDWEKVKETLNINLDELCKEIFFLDQQYDNNYIFSPFYQGVTFALAYLYFSKVNDLGKRRFWRKHALQCLSKCQQLFTQGRAYYDLISNHYFLYEDFNDREFQFGHAIQMAGTGVVAVLLKILRDDLA